MWRGIKELVIVGGFSLCFEEYGKARRGETKREIGGWGMEND